MVLRFFYSGASRTSSSSSKFSGPRSVLSPLPPFPRGSLSAASSLSHFGFSLWTCLLGLGSGGGRVGRVFTVGLGGLPGGLGGWGLPRRLLSL